MNEENDKLETSKKAQQDSPQDLSNEEATEANHFEDLLKESTESSDNHLDNPTESSDNHLDNPTESSDNHLDNPTEKLRQSS
ncbi:cag7 [Helicobacter pylori Hp H-10]|nr:cag7 [Helicobacter pylori Hp H-10]